MASIWGHGRNIHTVHTCQRRIRKISVIHLELHKAYV